MSYLPRLSHLFGIIIPLLALGILVALTAFRLRRVDDVTHLVLPDLAIDVTSPTGYVGGLRNLIVPEHNNESYQWIIQTQQMLAPNGHWRIREVRYDNAPIGRTILTPSPYRWWLALAAEADRLVSGRPIGLSVERIARIADPILFVLLIAGAVTLIGWRMGRWPAAVLSIAFITLFPLGGAFLPAQPNDGSLVLVCVSLSLLLLLAGIRPRHANGGGKARPARWFFASGAVLGVALWINTVRVVPVLVGVGFGGFLAVWSVRRATPADVSAAALPWRHWATGGAAAVLSAYLLEYYPEFSGSFNLREVHPLYGLAWLGLGELLRRTNTGPQPPSSWRNSRGLLSVALAVLAVASVPVVLVATGNGNFFKIDPLATCLTNFSGSPIAQNLWAWLVHDGINLTVVATCAPLFLIGIAGALLFIRSADTASRQLLTIALGPTLVVAGFACFQLRSWNEFDAVLLALVTAIAVVIFRVIEVKLLRGACLAGLLLALAPGAIWLTDRAIADRREPVSELEIQSLLERDLSHWLARQAGASGAVVLAPPSLTMSMIYYGGLSGLGTPFWENKMGFNAAMRIAGASSPDEAQAVANGRNLGYIVLPSWDNFLEEYARQGSSDVQHTLITYLQHWLPPRWLRPVPYHLPRVAGFEGQSVAIFKVVEVQDNATALSNLAEYFVEMEMMEQAVAVARALEQSFPADLSAAVARTLVAQAAQDTAAFTQASNDVQASLDRGDSDILAWDRRVSLAVALVGGRRLDQAKAEVKRCLVEIDESQLRSLTTVSLHRLLVMCRSFSLKIENDKLNSLAQQLLPPELRKRP